ncbi:VOC family protein [Bradyrhizobium sp. AUGA SZCCT0240]|uniref:VOC family protein n=1 Tax=unclassified Bradyrhizobium TaxID=2631580 RepID=UPI001BA4C299|nr:MULTISPECIES: VOC family protein [unclassified Bradyrhizobium]MBR1195105.1 VOC family protein [Bradyrhizobium sp. AUGA SZCCT0158]MBR1243783.1 VOC family protein [Bradyrhizobium sp. AUGA SZCCT0274]MBR1253016.1 VOC family protein [Bradyrhizobium sp. AUGA SZCCT0240]
MIHHVSVGTNDLTRAKAFYDPLMSLIGFRLLKTSEKAAHYGASEIVFSLETPADGLPATPGNGVHIAFLAPDRKTVRRFHESALASGGTDEGAPGIREKYNANYYGAFVRDLDGNKIEAVTFTAKERISS